MSVEARRMTPRSRGIAADVAQDRQVVEHQIDDDAGDGDIQPDREGDGGDAR